MTYKESLKKLNIEDYGERIFNSNSSGEHLFDYQMIATTFKDLSWFRSYFEEIVKFAEDNWNKPESIFQHILRIMQDDFKDFNEGEE